METVRSSGVGRQEQGTQVLGALPSHVRGRFTAWAAWVAAVSLAFVVPLTALFVYAIQSELHSYIPLVPFVSGYLLYTQRRPEIADHGPSLKGTLLLMVVGIATLAAGLRWRNTLSVNDFLGVMALSYVSFVAAGGFFFVGARWMRAAAFPLAFLVFLVPLPDGVVEALEGASVLGSADVSALLFRITNTPVVRDGTQFMLPGIVLRVAQECSGIRSSWVLLITSLIGSQLFLKSPWRRLTLVAFVVPLAIVRNGFRILVIGLLCVYVSPRMVDSPIHHRGGPLFFVLSLAPLFLLLGWLRRQEG